MASRKQTDRSLDGNAVPPQAPHGEYLDQVARAAYFLAERRGFSPGFEMDDWLAAEVQIRQRLDPA